MNSENENQTEQHESSQPEIPGSSKIVLHIIITLLYIVVTLSFVSLLMVITLPFYSLVEGEEASEDIVSPISFEAKVTAGAYEMNTSGNDIMQYKFDHSTVERSIENINKTFQNIESIQQILKQNPEAISSENVADLINKCPVRLSNASYMILINADPSSLFMMKDITISLTREEMEKGIKTDESAKKAIQRAINTAQTYNLLPQYKIVVYEILRKSIHSSMVADWEKIQKSGEGMKTVKTFIQKGRTIIKKGDRVTTYQMELLNQLKAQRKTMLLKIIIPIFCVCLVLLIITTKYIRAQEIEPV